MQTCGLKILGRITRVVIRRYPSGSGTCKGTPYGERRRKMTKIERFITEGNEKADELANAGAMLDEGLMAEVRAVTMKQEREEVYVALQYAASFHCLVEEWKDCEELRPKTKEKWIFVDKRRERMKHRTEWCAEANQYRCLRCRKETNT